MRIRQYGGGEVNCSSLNRQTNVEVPQDKLLECSKPLWGDLAAGSYDVGFQSLIVRDYSRCYELPRTSEEASSFSLTGRPMAVQVWYPAKPADNQATTHGSLK